MQYDPKDNEVIHLLKKLKESNGAYPPEMLSLRRQGYLKQVAQIGGGAGLAMGLRNIAKGGKGTAGMSSAGTLVEALLVVALIAEAGAVTYFYRDRVAEYIRSITRSPKVEEVASPPVMSSPIAEMQISPSPIVTVIGTETGTKTVTPGTPGGTPSPVLAARTSLPNGSSGVGGAAVSGSNAGNPPVSNDDNGNHYGQTPIPVRTKEQGNNNNNNKNRP